MVAHTHRRTLLAAVPMQTHTWYMLRESSRYRVSWPGRKHSSGNRVLLLPVAQEAQPVIEVDEPPAAPDRCHAYVLPDYP